MNRYVRVCPPSWLESRPRYRYLIVGGALVSSLVFLTSIWLAAGETTTSGWLGTGIGLMLGLATLTGYLVTSAAWKRGRTRAKSISLSPTRRATVMRYGRPQVVVTYATYATMTILYAVIPFFADQMDFSGVRGAFRGQIFLYLAPIVSVSAGPYLISPLIRKRQLLGIGLSPEGICHWSWFGCCFYRWDAIERIEPTAKRGLEAVLVLEKDAPQNSTDPEENWVGALPRYRRRLRRIPAGHLDTNPVVAYAALRYYLEHPEHRSELATDEAVRRIRQLDFPGM